MSTSNLLATFSPTNGAYKTKISIEPAVASSDEQHWPASNDVTPHRRRRHDDIPEAGLFGALICSCKSNCLLSYILGATLVGSVFNTILLSYVIKSLQLNDSGFINGKISWDDTIGGTVFELPTSLRPGKSISLNSIESHQDKPLKFLVSQPSDQTKVLFLSTMTTDKLVASDKNLLAAGKIQDQQANLVELSSHESNYMASSELDVRKEEKILEIGTKALKLDLIDASEQHRLLYRNTYNGSRSHETSHRRRTSYRHKLLEFDDESRSIVLPLERELRLHPEQTNSIALGGQLISDSIVGSHEQSLRVQTREGNLLVNCRDSLELVSKSSSVKVTAQQELSLSSASVTLSSSQGLYIANGIEYFNSEIEEANGNLAAAAAATGEADELVGCELLVVGGILRAEAA